MDKIIGILAIVFVYSREINAGHRPRQQDKEYLYTDTTKRNLESSIKFAAGGQWERYLQENVRNLPNTGQPKRRTEAPSNALVHSAAETTKSHKLEKTVRDDIDENNKPSKSPKNKKKHKKHVDKNHNPTERQEYDKARIGTEESHNKDKKHHENKHRMEEEKHSNLETTVRYNTEYQELPKEPMRSRDSNHNKYSKPTRHTKMSHDMTKKHHSRNEHKKEKRKPKAGTEPLSRDPKTLLKQAQEQAVHSQYKRRKSIRDFPQKKNSLSGDNYLDKHHNLRSTKMMALQERDDQDENQKSELSGGTPPQTLSPYALKDQMRLLMKEFPHANATYEVLDRTVEYNDILMVKITETDSQKSYFRVKEHKYIDDAPEKNIIFIVHGLTVMGMSSLSNLKKVTHVRALITYYLKYLDKFDIFLIPMANPDGYSVAVANNDIKSEVWNKNLSPQSVCSGVFLDRNFDVGWNSSARKISPCSQLYPGVNAFSEVETRAIRDVFHRYGHKIISYIHVHSGTYGPSVFKGDAVLYPRGYTDQQSNDDIYIDIKGEIDEAMKNASFRVMSVTVDTLYNWYGTVTGTSVDYASSVYGIPYSMEFVMQPYDDEVLEAQAMVEIWNRVINIAFNSMWNHLHSGDER